MRLKHSRVYGLKTGNKKIDEMKVKVCGERWSIYLCDLSAETLPHTWHEDSLHSMQWGTRMDEHGRTLTYPPATQAVIER